MGLLAIPYPAIDPVALRIGPLAVKWYGLAYVAGLLLGRLLYQGAAAAGPAVAQRQAPLSRPSGSTICCCT